MESSQPPKDQLSNFAWSVFFTPGRFALILALLLVATFPQVLLFGQSFVFRDFGLFNYPLAFFARESWWNGEVPLWNPYNNCGIPFLAQWNTQTLYPLSLIYFLIPLPWSVSFFCLLHLFWAGFGMYFLARRWTGNPFAASVAGIAFVFNGFMLNCLMWPHYMASFSWMPWTLLLVEKAWTEGRRTLFLATIVASMQMLGGTPEVVLLTWLLLTGLWIGALWRQRSLAKKIFVRFLLVIFLITSLCAAQLLPFLELLSQSQRTSGFDSSVWSIPFFGLGNFLVPLFRSFKTASGVFFTPEQSYTSSYYLGIGTLGLALMAAWRVREKRPRFLAIAALACILFSIGDKALIYKWVRTLVPVFTLMRYPVKFFILLTFLCPLLVAYGIRNELATGQSRLRRTLTIIGTSLGIGILCILWFSYTHPYENENWQVTLKSGLTRLGFLLAILFIFYRLAKTEQFKIKRLLAVTLLGLLWLDALTHTPAQNPIVSSEALRSGLPSLNELNPHPGLGQSRAMISSEARNELMHKTLPDQFKAMISYRLALYSDCNILDHLQKLDGLYSLYLRDEFDVRWTLYTETNSVFPHVLDFLSISQVTAPGKVLDWAPRQEFMPMVTAGQEPFFVEPTNSIRALFASNFNPRKMVLLPAEIKSQVSVTNGTEARIANQHWTAQRIQFDVDAQDPAMVAISQAHYPRWKGYVDGSAVPLWKANHAFQALEVKAGHHRVELVYEDILFKIGAVVSATTLMICIILFWRSRETKAALPLWWRSSCS